MTLSSKREWVFRDRFGRTCRGYLTSAAPADPKASDASATIPEAAVAGRLQSADFVRSLVYFATPTSRDDAVARAVLDMYSALTNAPLPDPSRIGDAAWRTICDTVVDAARAGALRFETQTPAVKFEAGEAATPPPTPQSAATGVTWFQLTVLDEIGDPVDGLDLTFTIAGDRRTVTTNGAGVARVDGVASGFATAALKSLDAVRAKMKPRWQTPRDPKRFEDSSIFLREIGEEVTAPAALSSETPATMVISPYFRCHEIPGAHFAFGRSFVLASAIENLASITEDLAADDGRQGMIFGHTDLAGPEALNKELSERRAKAVFALFTHDAGAWEELYSGTADGANWKEKWDLEEAQHMLNALGVRDDQNQAINEDGVRDASTKQAIHRFQAGDYPDKPAEQAPLATSDFLGVPGRKELFLAYAKRITRKPVSKDKFAKIGDASFMGCGEFNPLTLTIKDEESRRAVVFVFDAAAGPTSLPCKLRNLGPCNANCGPLPETADAQNPPYRCAVYKLVAKKCPCQGGPDLSHDLILRFPIKLEEADTLPHTYVASSDDGTITREKKLASDGRANDKQRVEIYFEHLPLTHKYKVTCNNDGDEPYDLFDFAKLPDIQIAADEAEHDDVGDTAALNDFWIDNQDAPPEDKTGATDPGGSTS